MSINSHPHAERQDENSIGRQGYTVMAVGGAAVGSFFTAALIVNQIESKFEEVASYPSAALGFMIAAHGLRKLLQTH